jgi:hypothetical protein
MSGGVETNDIEADVFAALAKKPDTVSHQFGVGYKDGLAGAYQYKSGKFTLHPEEAPVRKLVSEEIWKECNAILDDQRKNRQPAKRAAHLFVGYASTFPQTGSS